MRDLYSKRIIKAIQDFDDERLDDPQHVERWISQFSLDNQEIILRETASLLEKYYYSEDFLRKSLLDKAIEKLDKSKTYTLIPHHRAGSSRDYFTKFAEENFPQKSISLSNASNELLIVDDCIFSGNTLIRELEDWLSLNYRDEISITVITHGFHIKGARYLKYRLNKAKLEGNYKFNGKIFSCLVFEDSHLMLPRVSTELAQEYFLELKKYKDDSQTRKPLVSPRTFDIQDDKLFASPISRDIFEQEMLKYGIEVVQSASYPIQNSLRPMGFDAQLSYGFGAMYANFRNISNNCPLAFWYKSDKSYPL